MNTVVVAGTPQVQVVTATAAPQQAATFKSKDPTTFVEQTFGDPDTFDPALDYETAGAGINNNTYETLLWYKKDTTDLIPLLATEVPTTANGGISADGMTYTYKIRKGVKFHTGEEMTPSDVAYSLQRGLLQGGTSSPQWLMSAPILGSAANGIDDVTSLLDPDGKLGLADNKDGLQKVDAAKLKDACTKVTSAITADDNAGTVTVKLAQAWGPFNITMAGTWASVMNKKWVSANGGWDGSCDTWQKFYGVSVEEQNKTKVGTTEDGTGPYIVDHWTPKQEIVLKAFDGYWNQKPLWDGGPSGAPKIKTVIIKQVEEFSTRFAALQAGDADVIASGSGGNWPQLDTLVGETCDKTVDACKPAANASNPLRKVTGLIPHSRTDAFFNFKINTSGGNNFIGSGKLDGNGVPPEFFNDINVRKGFAYCFDMKSYIKSVFLGEGQQSPVVMLNGEPGYDANQEMYAFDADKCTAAFKASTLKAADGKSLWDTGFRMTIAYNTGNTARQTAAQIFQAGLSSVNPKFIIEVTGLPWPAFLSAQRAKKLTMFISGWQEDIPDPHNWLVPYASAGGTYSGRQSLPDDLLKQFQPLIDKGVHESDPAKRDAIYKQFNKLYFDNIPTFLLAVGFGRHYEQRWMHGYYFNPLYGDMYYYALSKD
ncbi:MAG TPA: ABC transporter substrate-binding protein [Anaerolineaceae bacterium]